MKYCSRCLNVTTRPNVGFDTSGLCYPCFTFIRPEEIDWEERRSQLEIIKQFAMGNSSGRYNCIVGVSGGKDSTRQAVHIRDVFELRPLLVSMNYPPQQMSQRGADNLSNLIKLGFDCVNISCAPQTWCDNMRYAFTRFGNWAKATEFALFASVPRIAIAYQIPLIFWGESAASQLGEMGVLGEQAFDGNRLKYSNTLGGGDVTWLLESGKQMHEILQYVYPSDDEMRRASLKIVFMDYFMKDFSGFANGNFSALRGLSIRKANPYVDPDYFGTSMLDEDFINVNMFIRYLKFGFGRTTDIVNLEIRNKRMSRDEGIRLVEAFDGNFDPECIQKFCCFIGITEIDFWGTVDRFVNSDLFERKGVGVYRRKFKVGVGL